MSVWYSATPTSVAASALKVSEMRDSLRHRRHRHPHAHRVADDDAEHQSADDPAVVDDRVVEQRAGDGEQHADRRLLHAAPCLVGPRETAQSENEQDRRDEVADLR